MQKFEIANASGRSYSIGIEEVTQPTDALLKTLIDIDLQTFTESTFSHYTAAAFFHSGRICLLYTSPSPRDKRQSRMPSSA